MKQKSKYLYLYLLIPVLLWPILWSTGGVIYIPRSLFGDPSRAWWWSFFVTVFIFEWLVFLFIRYRLSNEGGWKSIGLDTTWFVRNRKWLIPYVVFFLAAAVLAPGFLYGDDQPSVGQIIPITAVSWQERLFFVFVSMTAGICEEITFRGVGITRFTKLLGNKWIAVLITSLCFVFIHGPFQGWMWFAQYFSVALMFGIGFALMKQRRLEVLILIHFTIDASLAVFVP